MVLVLENLPAKAGDMREMGSALDWEDPLEKGNPLQYSCLGIPWTEEPGGLQSIVSPRLGHD